MADEQTPETTTDTPETSANPETVETPEQETPAQSASAQGVEADEPPQAEQPEQSPQATEADEAPQAKQPEQVPQAEQPEQAPQAEQPEEAPQAEQPEEAPQAEQPEEAPQAERPQQAPEATEAGADEDLVIETQQVPDGEMLTEVDPTAAPRAEARAEDEERPEPQPRAKPAVPGAHLEVDIVPEGVDPLGRGEEEDPYAVVEEEEAPEQVEEQTEELTAPISSAAIDLASGARYRATGKRKSAIARVTLRPGNGAYVVNGRTLEQYFPRETLGRNIRQPLETVGYQDQMDVVARLHGGGISAQAGALRHGVSRALLEADPNLRGELKRRGFLTRDSRAKERKKAGLKKARKRPQFSKR